MKIVTSNEELQLLLANAKGTKSIGLVPTMGNLHCGHLKLINAAVSDCDLVVCSIFVNPTQFGPGEDLANYPRTLDADKEKLNSANCDIVFLPSVAEMYGNDPNNETAIHVPGVSANYCGQSRPGHFDGVATIVCKLLNIVQPTASYFGLKDYQQFLVINKLVNDLRMPVKVVGIETERESSGLAKSSRNNYLEPKQLDLAAELYATLQWAAGQLKVAKYDFKTIEESAKTRLDKQGLTVDYFSICNSKNLSCASVTDSELTILAAVFLGKTRLIDNIHVR
ncbi:MAG: pantoate--beta-alanine ligase [Pseudohongiellaceae bacterium]|jgi:pantoate--beta-alanine ligase